MAFITHVSLAVTSVEVIAGKNVSAVNPWKCDNIMIQPAQQAWYSSFSVMHDTFLKIVLSTRRDRDEMATKFFKFLFLYQRFWIFAQQASIWTNAGPVYWHIYASPDLDELNYMFSESIPNIFVYMKTRMNANTLYLRSSRHIRTRSIPVRCAVMVSNNLTWEPKHYCQALNSCHWSDSTSKPKLTQTCQGSRILDIRHSKILFWNQCIKTHDVLVFVFVWWSPKS